MEKKDQTLIIGASGQVGSGIVRLLKEMGHPVRQATSQKNPGLNHQDADKVTLDLTTGEGLREAFEGIDRAFFLAPPPHADHYKILSPLIQEAKRRGLKKTVLMTAWGANAVETSPFRRAEIELEKSGLTFNIIRPNWFMQNFATFWLQGIKEQDKILLPAGNGKTSFIDTKDISAVAATLLTTHQHDNKAFDLSGPEALDHHQVASLISAAVGRKISYVDIDPADLRKGFLAAGVPSDYTDFLLMILGFLKEGYNSGISDSVQRILGRAPRSFQQYVQENKQSWL